MDAIRLPDIEEFRSYKNVKMITVAPELEGAMEFIENCGISVALGHTVCDYDTACEAFDRGANCLTHTFNAMPPLHHRRPGPIGAAIDKNAYVQVITDGFHLHGSVVKMLYRTFGPDRMVIISDSVAPAGLPDGEYVILSRPHIIKNSHAFLPDGTIAGSVLRLNHAVRNLAKMGVPLHEAVNCASLYPAETLKLQNERGEIKVGLCADLSVCTPEMEIISVYKNGKLGYRAE